MYMCFIRTLGSRVKVTAYSVLVRTSTLTCSRDRCQRPPAHGWLRWGHTSAGQFIDQKL